MTDEAEVWRFRALTFSASQGSGKALNELLDLLRADFDLTAADKVALADFLDKGRPGRPKRSAFDPIQLAVQKIREIQAQGPAKLAQAIEIFQLGLRMQIGDRAAEAHFRKYEGQIRAELRRAKPAKIVV